jgi:hypothetical protein
MSKNDGISPLKPESPDSAKFHSRGPEFKKMQDKRKENGKEKFKEKPM